MSGPRVGVVGCGYWGKNLVRNFAELGALEAVCDADAGAAAAQAGRWGVRSTPGFREMLDDKGVDAVAISTPAAMHATHVREALLAGKDVFIEKPLALTYAEGKALVELAEARHRVLMVGHLLHYHPAVEALHALVKRGELGRILYVYSSRLNLGKIRREENILWSFAPHDISLMLELVGEDPATIRSSGGSYLTPGVADVTVTTFDFPGGARGHIFVSWLHPYKEQKLVVVGDRKMAVFDDTLAEGKLRVLDKGVDWKDGFPTARAGGETVVPLREAEPLKVECGHFLDRVKDRRTPRTDGINALRVLRALQAGQLSLERAGAPVDPKEVDRA